MIQLRRKFYDFLVAWKENKRLECLAALALRAENVTTVSMNEFLLAENVPYGYKFVDGNVGVLGKKITLPHYMAIFL